MRIILHAGYHKTATTWFQQRLYPHVKNFEYFKNRNDFRELVLNKDYYDFCYKTARLKIENLVVNDFVVCEENILGGLRENSLITIDIANRLKQVFPEAQMVFFIRSQPSRLASTYLYYLKQNGGTYSPKKFIQKQFNLPNKRGDINFSHLEYHRVIELYKKLFGVQNVHVFLYEEFAKDNWLFIENYCSKMGLEVDISTINFAKENEGLRKGLVNLARFLGCFYQKPIIHKSVFLQIPYAEGIAKRKLRFLNKFGVFGDKPTPKELFGQELYGWICNYYKESNQMLVQKHGLTQLKDFDYPL